MSKLRVESFTISLDGFGAGPDQDINNPLGVGGTALHGWALSTKTFQKNLFGNDGGAEGLDEDFAARGFQNIGAWILGRNMFGPVRGPWPDDSWRGWWGDNPVYHVPVFVLTNHARAPLLMEGKRIKAAEAQKMGLIHAVVEVGAERTAARQWVLAAIAAHCPVTAVTVAAPMSTHEPKNS